MATTGGGGGGATNVVTNGGFESSATPWTVSSGVCAPTPAAPARRPTAAPASVARRLRLGAHRHRVAVDHDPGRQDVRQLTFYLHIDTKETGTTAYDKLTVGVTSGGTTTTLATYSNVNAAAGYVLKTISLNAYIGKTITLKFTGTEDSSLATSFVLDDVAVTVQ